ncbi:MAG: LPS export ABC transporter periplasmic protein LptC [Gammaproteobacteria bacterium]|nr:MAG: LPS export ABC transporter periplasmic protein LptC [Gammaproteobacteria bacterium]
MKLRLTGVKSAELERINPMLLPLPWVVVGILVVVFATIKYSSTEEKTAAEQADVKVFPHTYLVNIEVQQFDEAGNLRYQMNSPLVRSFQVNETPSAADYSLFTTPVFVLSNNPQKPSWYVTAKEGQLDNKDEWLTLKNDVLARQTSEKQGETTITTNELRLNTQQQFAETDKAVTMRAAKSEITAVGMRAEMKREHIQLLSHVKGTYEP